MKLAAHIRLSWIPVVFILLIACMPWHLQAQSNTLILNGIQTGSPNNVACKEIRLQSGYKYTGQAGQEMRSKIDPILICDVDYIPPFTNTTIPPLNLGLEVGSTPGSFAVTQTGAATYNIPLMVSPGTAGMVPNLSVSYSSQSGDGLMGIGWNLSGLSSISRTTRNPYLDNTVAGVTLSNADPFALDGNRLITYSGSNGADNTIYGTEIENFSRITSYTSGVNNGPAWFKVETKDGSILEYGNTADSRIEPSSVAAGGVVLTWLLNKVTDSRGNFMNIYYYENNSTGEFRPDHIEYTGNTAAGLTPYNTLKFVYETRQDKQTGYVAGYPVRQKTVLSQMLMYAENNLTHSFRFSYSNNMNTHLSSVSEAGRDGKEYNPTSIVWNTNDVNPVFSSIASNPIGGLNGRALDVNGDGFDDKIWVGDGLYRVWMNDQHGVFTAGNQLSYTTVGANSTSSAYEKYGKNYANADFTGDGYDDMVVLTLSQNKEDFKCTFLKSDGTGLVEHPNTFTFHWDVDDEAQYKCAYGDFNGDGATDLFVYFYDADKGYIIDFKNNFSWIQVIGAGTPYDGELGDRTLSFYSTDLNGDGKQEIFYTYGLSFHVREFNGTTITEVGAGGYPNSYHRIFPGDFNGDGKTDLLTWSDPAQGGAGSGWLIGYSTGSMNTINGVQVGLANNGDPAPASGTPSHWYAVQDFNGDGKSDILDIGPGSATSFSLWHSTGNVDGFMDYPNTDFTHGDYIYNNSPKNPISVLDFITDFDGDGRKELYADFNAPNNGTLSYKISLMAGSDVHKVNSITDGLHNTTKIYYNTLSILASQAPNQPNQYTKGTGATYPVIDFQKSMTVVSHLANAACGNSDAWAMRYYYEGAKIHLQGKGFLGFTKVKTSDLYNNFVTENTYETGMTWLTGNFFQPVLTNSKTSTLGGQGVNEKTISSSNYIFLTGLSLPLPDNSGKRYHFYLYEATDNDLLHGNITTINTQQDQYGNTNAQSSNNTAGTNLTRIFFEQKGAWIPSRPYYNIFTATRLGEPVYTRFSNITNDAFGQPTVIATDNGVTTTITYNQFGLPETTIVSATDIPVPLTTLTEYDSRKRFITRQTNPKGHIAQSTYDAGYGNVLTQTDVNGLITSYTYDGFGRLSTTTPPAPTPAITVTRAWAVGTSCQLYSVTTSQAGTPTSKQFYDNKGRVRRSETTAFDGSTIFTTKTYNTDLGQLVSESEPNSTTLFTTYTYETDFKRLKKVTSPGGTTVENTYTYGTNTNQIVTTAGTVRTVTKTTDASGLLVNSTDEGGTLTYLYHSSGNPRSITAPGSSAVTMEYDAFGRQTKLTDPNAGITTYKYDKLGQLVAQQTAKQFAANSTYSTTTTYDVLGRVTKIADQQAGDVDYVYDTAPGKGIGLLASITHSGVLTNSYSYDNYSRLLFKTQNIDATPYTYSYTYDSQGRVDQETYPGTEGFTIKNNYNAYGYLSKIDKVSGTTSTLWRCDAMNEWGQVTQATLDAVSANPLIQTSSYTSLGNLQNKQLKNGGLTLYNTDYNFDAQTVNLNTRKDVGRNLTETFSYDNLDRLIQVSKTTATQSFLTLSLDYNTNGNISNKSDVGDYGYNPGSQPHAVNQIATPSAEMQGLLTQNITYTSFSKVATIFNQTAGQGYNGAFAYGPNQQRTKMTVFNGATEQYRRYYSGNYEKTIAGTTTRELYYVGNAIVVRNSLNGTPFPDTTYYIQTDHLGSIAMIIKETNKTAAFDERSYDAWGRQRNPVDWSYTGIQAFKVLARGYTGHEHIYLPNIMNIAGGELINMNGRIYDPVVGRMLSPDNYVQAGGFTQSYNRYSYVWNNPMKFTDPDGEWVAQVVGGIMGGYAGYNLGKASGATGLALIGYTLGGTAIGAISGGAGSACAGGIGAGANTMGIISSSFLSSGGMSMMSGGRTDMSIAFGVGSYNFSSGELGFLGKPGNSVLENVGYGFGALANIQDAFAGSNGTNINVRARKELFGHSESDGMYDGKPLLVSVGPAKVEDVFPKDDSPLQWEMEYVKRSLRGNPAKGENVSYIEAGSPQVVSRLHNVSGKIYGRMTDNLNNGFSLSGEKILRYGLNRGCVNYTSRALFNAGVLNINALLPVTAPLLLNFELGLRQVGIFASPYLTTY